MPRAPLVPAGAPPYAKTVLNDLVDWVRALLKQPAYLPGYPVLGMPDPTDHYSSIYNNSHSSMIFVTNESGGAVPAFTDGINWRRVTDRAIVS